MLAKNASPYASLFREAVIEAHKINASDIHIEPLRDGVCIRFRVYGAMMPPWKLLGLEHKQSFIVAVKKETRLAIGVSGRPQDSRAAVVGVPVDLRVNLLPTLFGEKIVLRLLDANREFGLANIGLPNDTLQDLLRALEFKNGVVLMSGPTGSGKTTTLYSMLCALDRTKKNIVTLEDPVEYTIAGINQVKIDPKVSFSQALRAVLRQDPDVILVGEIRDEETATLAFKASATGHLVLSTVHANGALEVVGRLGNLGIDRDTLRENLRFSAAQRLLPRLCSYCAQGAAHIDPRFKTIQPSGCRHCRDGIMGRLPVMEYLTSPGLTAYFNGGKKTQVVTQNLSKAALVLAKEGLIDYREVENIG